MGFGEVRKRKRGTWLSRKRERNCVVGKWVKTIESRKAAQSDGWLVRGSRQKCLASVYLTMQAKHETRKPQNTFMSQGLTMLFLEKFLKYFLLPIS